MAAWKKKIGELTQIKRHFKSKYSFNLINTQFLNSSIYTYIRESLYVRHLNQLLEWSIFHRIFKLLVVVFKIIIGILELSLSNQNFWGVHVIEEDF